jgi:ribonuclease G
MTAARMSEEILINVTSREARVGVVENGMLQEVYIERDGQRGSVGNIYCGRVARVMSGMQAAFVDIGLERSAFLHAGDAARPRVAGHAGDGVMAGPGKLPAIAELVHEGQRVVVQVIKDPIGSKGARVSMHLSVPSRYLVLLPDSDTRGVSVRIEDEAERERLRGILARLGEGAGFGLIARTRAEGMEESVLAEDIAYVARVWRSVSERIEHAQPGEQVYQEPPLPLRVFRDLMHDAIEKVRVDSHASWQSARDFARDFMPALAERIEHYPDERPIFDLYGAEDDIAKALRKQVPLKSGGYLVMDQTEAMTTVDVNTGAYLGNRNLEETALRANLEAAQALARQLRLRNLGGLIIIDFIDMQDEGHKRQVVRTLEQSLAPDHARTSVCEMSALGLVEMTRQRTTESLARQLCEPCLACSGRGIVKTAETVGYEIFREIARAVRQFEGERLLVLASPRVVTRMLEDESEAVAELEAWIGKSIRFQPEEQYPQEQFDVVLV